MKQASREFRGPGEQDQLEAIEQESLSDASDSPEYAQQFGGEAPQETTTGT